MVLTLDKKEDFVIIRTNMQKINYENANKFSKDTVEFIENEEPENLAIDFHGIMYISSIGISALSVIKGISKMNQCNLVLFNLSRDVASVLEQTGINSMFKILETEEELEEYFKG